nr:putative Ig domain-containing protein [uncultured Shewanella sp.]
MFNRIGSFLLTGLFSCCVYAADPSSLTVSGAFTYPTVGDGNINTLTLTLTNATGSPAREIGFSATIEDPVNFSFADPVNVVTTCGEGSYAFTSSVLTISGYFLPADGTCQFSLDFTGQASGSLTVYDVTVSGLTSDLGPGTDPSSPIQLSINPSFITASLSAAHAELAVGSINRLTLALTNLPFLGGTFYRFPSGTIAFPTGMTLGTPVNFSSSCGATNANAAGSASFVMPTNFANGTSCTMAFDVVASEVGTQNIISGTLMNPSTGQAIGKASTSYHSALNFVNATFSPLNLTPGGTGIMTVSLLNTDRDNEATNITFIDNLDAALSGLVATSTLSNTCGVGSTLAGTSSLLFAGGTLAAGESCELSVAVAAPSGAAPGTYINTISSISYDLDGINVTPADAINNFNINSAPTLTVETKQSGSAVTEVAAGTVISVEYSLTNVDATNAASSVSFTHILSNLFGFTATLPANDFCGTGSTATYNAAFADGPSMAVSGISLSAEGTCSFSVDYTVPASFNAGTFLMSVGAITATINSQVVQSVAPSASQSFSIITAPKLSFVFNPAVVSPGENTTIDFEIQNSFGSLYDATAVGFSMDLDAVLSGITVLSVPDAPCGESPAVTGTGTGAIALANANVAIGETCQFSVSVQVPSGASSQHYSFSSSALTASLNGVNLTSSAASSTLQVTQFSASKSFSPSSLRVGNVAAPLTLTYVLNNADPVATVSSIAFTESFANINSTVTVVSTTQADVCGVGSSATISGKNLTFTGGSLAPSTSCTFDVVLNLPANFMANGYSSVSSSVTALVDATNTTFEPMYATFLVNTLSVVTGVDITSPTSETTILMTIDFSDDVQSFVEGDITVTNATLSNFQTISPKSYTVDVTPVTDGNVTLNIAAGVAQDVLDANVTNTAAYPLSFEYQTTPLTPTPSLSIGSPSALLTSSTPVTYTVSYLDAETVNLTTAAISLNMTGDANADVSVENGDSTPATVRLTNFTGNGSLGISIAANTARNSINLAPAAGPSGVFSVDTHQPTATLSASTNQTAAFTVNVVFEENVTDFTVDDISVAGGTLSNFQSTDAKNYSVLVSASGETSLTLTLADSVAHDGAGNGNSASNTLNITYDDVHPGVGISGPISPVITSFTATIDFTEVVTGFDVTDIQATNANLSGFTNVDGKQYTVSVAPIAQTTVELAIDVDVAVDSLGNGNAAATSYSVLFDFNDAPMISGTPATSVNEDSAYSFTPTASDDDSGDILSFVISNQPSWANFNSVTGQLSGTPTNADVGTNASIVIGVFDGTVTTNLSSFSITVSNVNDAPVITSTALTAATQDVAYSYGFSASDDDVGDVVSLSAVTKPSWLSFNPATGVLSGTPSNADVGSHAVSLTATDAGNLTAEQSFTLVVSNVNDAPVITSTALTAATQDVAYSYHFSASDDDVGDVVSLSAVTKPSWLSFNPATGVLSGTPSNADVGSHAVSLTATDAGNLTAEQSFTLVVSNVNDAPVITSTALTAATQDVAYSYSFSASDDDVGDVVSLSAVTKPSWLSFNPATGVLSGTPSNADVGSHAVSLKATDAGSLTAEQSFTLVVSNVNDAPVITSTALTAATQDVAYSYGFSASDDDVGDVVSLSVVTKPSWLSFNPATGVLSGTPSNADVGSHAVSLTATDAGNLTAEQSFTLVVSNVNDAPVITSTALTAATQDVAYSYSFSASDDDVGDVVSLSAVTKPSWLSFNPATGVLSGTPSNADVGSHAVSLTATDAGNLTAEQSFTLVVSNVNDAPVITSTALTAATQDVAYSYSFSASDDDVGDVVSLSAVTKPSWLSFNPATGVLSGTPSNADVGSHAVSLKATDAGSLTAEQSFTLVVSNVNDAPVITSTALTAATQDVAYSYGFSASDDDVGDVVSLSVVTKPSWLSFNPATGVLSGTPSNADVGSHAVSLTATDAGNLTAEQSFTLVVSNVNDAPVITSTALTAATQDVAYSYSFSASDDDVGDMVSLSAVTKPSWLSFNPATGVLSGTPSNADVGSHAVSLTATDAGNLMAEQSFTLVVSNVNDAPVITSTALTAATQDVAYSYSFSASDDDVGDVVSLSAVTKPSWLSFNPATGVLSGTPSNADVGSHAVSLTATDAGNLTAEQSFTLVVSNVNDAPVITSTALTAATQDVAYSYSFSASDDDVGDVVSLSAVTKPSWLSFNPATGVLSGTPSNADVGSHAVSLTATDAGSLTAEQSFTLVVSNVNDAPVITSTALTAATQDVAYSYGFSASDDDVGDVVSLSAVTKPSWLSFNPATGVLSGTPSNADVGSHAVSLTATDAGNLTAEQSFTLVVSNVNDAPVITSTALTAATQDVAYSYSFSASDDDVGDMVSLSAVTKPSWLSFNPATGVLSGTPSNADVGSHAVSLKATDAGNLMAEQSFTLVVSNVNDAPVITSTALTAATQDVAYSYSFSASDDDVGDVVSLSAVTKPSWLSFNPATGVLSGTPSNADVGSHAVSLKATDAGNLTAEQSFTLVVSNVNDAPVITSTALTAATQDVAYSYSFSASDDDVGDVVSLSAVTKPSWLSFNPATGVLSGTPSNADVGSHAVSLKATDAGSLTAEQSFTLVVSNVNDAPVITSTALTAATQDVAYSYGFSASDDDVGDVVSLSVVTKPSWLSFNPATGVLSGTPSNADVGSHAVSLTATDAGNLTAEQSFTLVVSNVNDAPVITSTALTAATQDVAYSYGFSASDDDVGDVVSLSVVTKPSWLSFNPATGVLSGTPSNADVGSHAVSLKATDAGNLTAEQSFTLVVSNVNDAPVITSTALTAATQDVAYSYSFSASDDDVGDVVSLSAVTKPSWLSFNPATGVLSGTPSNADVGSHAVSLTATDAGSLTAEQSFTLVVSNVNDAPVITSTALTAASQDVAYSYSFSASDDDVGDVVSLSAVTKPSWLSFNPATGVLSGTPSNADVGSHAVSLTATDAGSLTAEQSFTLVVSNVNDAPVITSTALTAATQDVAYSYGFSASDDDVGDVVSLSAVTKPSWLSFNPATGVLSGTPSNADVGSHAVSLTATDAGNLTAEQSFTLVVSNVNDAPVITSTALTAATQDVAYSYSFSASDDDVGDVVSLSAVTKPSWLSFNPATGVLSGTPSNADVGSHAVSLTATDAGSLTAEQSFTLVVSNVNDAPVITSTALTAATQDVAYSYSFSASDDDVGDVVSLSAVTKPSWLSFNPATGVLSGTPSNADVGSHAVSLTATDAGNLTAEQSFTLVVSNVNDAPVISGTPSIKVEEDTAYSFVPVAKDEDEDDSLTFNIVNKPSWADFNSATGALTGTPSNDDVGITTGILISVSDGAIQVDFPVFDIEVVNVNDAPVFDSMPVIEAISMAPYQYQVVTSDIDLDSELTVALESAPNWLELTASNKLVGTPPLDAADSSFSVVLSVTDGIIDTPVLQEFTLVVKQATETSVAFKFYFSPGTATVDQNVNLMIEVTNIGYAPLKGLDYQIHIDPELNSTKLPSICSETTVGLVSCHLADDLAIGMTDTRAIELNVVSVETGFTNASIDLSANNLVDAVIPKSASLLLANTLSALSGQVITSVPADTGVIADINGDGLNDLLVYLPLEQSIQLMINDGAGMLVSTNKLVMSQFVSSMAVADLNDDGVPDIVTIGGKNGGNRAYILDADLNVLFEDALDAVIADLILITDLDSDGDPEVILGGVNQPTIALYSHVGSGEIGLQLLNVTVPFNLDTKVTQALSSSILNVTDTPTLLSSNSGGVSSMAIVKTMLGNQLIVFIEGEAPILYQYIDDYWEGEKVASLSSDVTRVVATDINANGQADLFVFDKKGWHLILDALGAEAVHSSVAFPFVDNLVVVDLEGDGIAEILLQTSSGVSIWHYHSVNDIRPDDALIVSKNIAHIELVDLDNDGDLDIVVFDTQVGVSIWYVSSTGAIGRQDVDLALFADSTSFPKLKEASIVTWTVQNKGIGQATEVTLEVTLDSQLHLTQIAPGCSLSDLVLRCSIGTLAVGESRTIEIWVTPFISGNLRMNGSVNSLEHDVSTTNNQRELQLNVISPKENSSGGSVPWWAVVILMLFMLRNNIYFKSRL